MLPKTKDILSLAKDVILFMLVDDEGSGKDMYGTEPSDGARHGYGSGYGHDAEEEHHILTTHPE